MNLISFSILIKISLLLFLSLITIIFFQYSDAFSHNDCAYPNNNTNSIPNCSNYSLLFATVSVNGDTSDLMISYVKRDQNILINAQTFCNIVGGQYFPLGQNYGLMVQGKLSPQDAAKLVKEQVEKGIKDSKK